MFLTAVHVYIKLTLEGREKFITGNVVVTPSQNIDNVENVTQDDDLKQNLYRYVFDDNNVVVPKQQPETAAVVVPQISDISAYDSRFSDFAPVL
jgi:hypothetical protein